MMTMTFRHQTGSTTGYVTGTECEIEREARREGERESKGGEAEFCNAEGLPPHRSEA